MLPKKTLFVIDDDKNIHYSLEVIFQDDYKLKHAFNARNVYEMININFDLVFLDKISDTLDANIELLTYLKAKKPKIPIIIISAYLLPEDRDIMSQMGATDFIDKPFDIKNIRDKVSKLLYPQQ